MPGGGLVPVGTPGARAAGRGLRLFAVLTVISVGCLASASRLLVAQGAPSGGTVWDGVFTEAQASRGEAAYGRSCAVCHKEDLLGGGTAPALWKG